MEIGKDDQIGAFPCISSYPFMRINLVPLTICSLPPAWRRTIDSIWFRIQTRKWCGFAIHTWKKCLSLCRRQHSADTFPSSTRPVPKQTELPSNRQAAPPRIVCDRPCSLVPHPASWSGSDRSLTDRLDQTMPGWLAAFPRRYRTGMAGCEKDQSIDN